VLGLLLNLLSGGTLLGTILSFLWSSE
jgi:hypothetical protein